MDKKNVKYWLNRENVSLISPNMTTFSVSSTNKWRVLGQKKKTRTVREREILAPLLTDLERFGHRSSTGGCKRLVEANFSAITVWTLRLCKRKFLLFSFSIWRDLVKGFYFFEKDYWRSSYSFTAISFWFFVSIDPSFAFWFGVS